MTFERPLVLLLLLAAPLLLLFIRRRLELRPRPVTTFLIFKRALARLQLPPRRRFRSWRELPRLLPLILALTALAGPRLLREREASPLVLVDVSPSMGTRTREGTRLERGLRRIRDLLPEARLRPVAGVVEEGTPRPLAVFTPLPSIEERCRELLAAGERVVLLTDRQPRDLPDACGLLLVGDDRPDAGLTAATLDEAGRLLLRGVSRGETGKRRVVLSREGPQGSRSLREEEIGTWPFRLVWEGILPASDALLRVRLEPADANPLDDEVWLAPPPRPFVVGLPVRGLDVLERAFAADPQVIILRGEGPCDLRVGASGEGRARLLLPPLASGGFRTGAVRRVRGPMRALGALSSFPMGDEQGDDPVYEVLEAPPDHEVLLTLDRVPLLVRAGDVFALLVDPRVGAWKNRRSFPLILSEVTGLLGRARSGIRRAWRGGEAIKVRSPAGADPDVHLEILPPGLPGRSVAVDEDGFFRFVLSDVGPHRLRLQGLDRSVPGWPLTLTCAVLSREAVLAATVTTITWRPPAPSATREDHAVPLEPWLLLPALLLLLLFECVPRFQRAGIHRNQEFSRP